MWQVRLGAFLILLAGVALGYFVYWADSSGVRPFKFGLDLTGGTHLVYEADTSELAPNEVNEAMQALRDVIERRVNLFGVSEPIVQAEGASLLAGGEATERLIVELPGVTDVQEAIELIGQTPLLEFKLVADPTATSSDARYAATGLTGRYVSRASLEFVAPPTGGVPTEPVVAPTFNTEGAEMFETITGEHVG
jgi:preprotein translocase subunit SecD